MDGLPAGGRYSFQSPPSRLDGIPSSKVHVIGRDIAQGLVVATPVVVLDEPADLGFRIPGSVQNNQMDAFLARAMIASNLPIGLRRIGRSPDPSLVGASSYPEPGHTGRLAAPAAVNYCLLNGGTPPSQAPQLSFSFPYLV